MPPSSNAQSTAASLPDYYAVLGVSQSASTAEIGSAYRSQALNLHPDKHTNSTEHDNGSFQRLLHAYSVLTDADRRQQYNQQRQSRSTADTALFIQLSHLLDDAFAYPLSCLTCPTVISHCIVEVELRASAEARAQLWTEVRWTELEYATLPETQHTEEEEEEEAKEARQDTEAHHGRYSYVCKCGYRYIVSEALLDRLLDEDDKEVEELRLSCEWCSLGLHITSDKR